MKDSVVTPKNKYLGGQHKLIWIILVFGIILRLVQYLYNRSLWLDEAKLALNIINKSVFELGETLSKFQYAPVGFLAIEKLTTQALGNNEFALRLFPLFGGILSVFLFSALAKKVIEPTAAILALGLFSISSPLIFYSSDLKPYATDLAFSLLIYWATLFILSQKLTYVRILLFGLLGAISIWFSLPALFLLMGIGLSLTMFSLVNKEWSRVFRLFLVYAIWLLSLVAYYFLSIRPFLTSSSYSGMKEAWNFAFMPFPPNSLTDIQWLINTFFEIFHTPAGFYFGGLAAFTFIVGFYYLLKKKKELLFLLISPILVTLAASALHAYPFYERSILFIMPAIFILIGEGSQRILNKTWANSKIIGIALIGLLFFHPLLSAGKSLFTMHTREEIKIVMQYLKANQKDGDILYVYYGAESAFEYYKEKFNLNEIIRLRGRKFRGDPQKYTQELNEVIGNERVWFLFSHVYEKKGINEERFFINYLNTTGKKTDSLRAPGASVYLYDLKLDGSK